jgi:uncharacterized membrane protein YkvA (DUF1232 family)
MKENEGMVCFMNEKSPMEVKTWRFRKKAEQILQDPRRLEGLMIAGLEKADRQKERLRGFWSDLKALFRLVRAYTKGDYRAVPWKTLVAAVTALVYFISPLDFIPDFLVGGFLDDALVVGWILSSIKNDLDVFVFWENMGAAREV